jgi:hypothetical protein
VGSILLANLANYLLNPLVSPLRLQERVLRKKGG